MSFTLRDVLAQARFAHPGFTEEAVPSVVLGSRLSYYQRDLVRRAVAIRRDYLVQDWVIHLDLDAQNQPGTVGSGTAGGLPSVESGLVEALEATAGRAIGFDTTDAVVHQDDAPASATTSSTLSIAGAPWTVNEHATRLLELVHGPGLPRQQLIPANTAGQLTGLAFTENPTTDTVFRIVALPSTSRLDEGVVTRTGPGGRERSSYLVKLDSSGSAYIDYSSPLVARLDAGVPVPPNLRLVTPGSVRFGQTNVTDATGLTSPFHVVPARDRHSLGGGSSYCGYLMGQQLYLLGTDRDWSGVVSIDIPYVPVPPDLDASLDALFLLPDEAFDAVRAGAELIAARWLMASRPERGDVDLGSFAAGAAQCEADFLTTVMRGKLAVHRQTRRLY